ncbi:hypothetical protein COP2_008869 [Malus domestica]
MVANSLTSFLNLEIEFKFPLTKDGTTTASILILFFKIRERDESLKGYDRKFKIESEADGFNIDVQLFQPR